MSIWSSVEGDDIDALDGHEGDVSYTAKGEPSLKIDVATARHFHDHIRLAIWDKGTDVCALLSPAAAMELRRKLGLALGLAEAGD